MATDDAIRQAEIRARAQAATKGPWEARCSGVEDGAYQPARVVAGRPNHVATVYVAAFNSNDCDADFCAHARQDIPYLLQRLEEAEQENDRAHGDLGFTKNDLGNALHRAAQLESALAAARQEMADLEATWRKRSEHCAVYNHIRGDAEDVYSDIVDKNTGIV